MLIQDRIRTIMKSGNLSASEFADKIDVKRSNLSHVLSGRNKPSLDFLVKVINTYPKVNAAWLITGEARTEVPNQENAKVKPSKQPIAANNSEEKEIERILMFYTDGTFDSFTPNEQ